MSKEYLSPKKKRGRPAKVKLQSTFTESGFNHGNTVNNNVINNDTANVNSAHNIDNLNKIRDMSNLHSNAPENNYFVLCNGKPIKNVKELADIMDELEDHVFNHHVRPDHNDFANWVKDIFKEVELAEKIINSKDKNKMQLVIYKHLTHKLW
jgi:hypothetical protein